jgi:hypothetical protein
MRKHRYANSLLLGREPAASVELEQQGMRRGPVLESRTSGEHLLGLLKEVDGCSTITCGQSRLGIFQQGIVAFHAGFGTDRLGSGV